MTHNNDSIRNKLIEIINQGLMLKAIALNVGIDVIYLQFRELLSLRSIDLYMKNKHY